MNSRSVRDQAATAAKTLINTPLSWFGLALTRTLRDKACTRQWVAEAAVEGMAVNDFIEKDHHKPAREELDRLVFPHLTAQSIVCEVGPGTGVYSRYLNQVITGGELHLVDSDPHAIAFLKKHLPANPCTRLHLTSGTRLPFARNAWMDLAFGASIFTGGNLSYLFRYLQEFSLVLKPAGLFIFDYFDVATEAGRNVLLRNMARQQPIFAYTYHATATIDWVAGHNGFRIVARHPTARGSVFVTAQKQ